MWVPPTLLPPLPPRLHLGVRKQFERPVALHRPNHLAVQVRPSRNLRRGNLDLVPEPRRVLDRRAIDDPVQPRPKTARHAHRARLARRIQRVPLQRPRLQLRAGEPDCDDLAVRARVVVLPDPVHRPHQRLARLRIEDLRPVRRRMRRIHRQHGERNQRAHPLRIERRAYTIRAIGYLRSQQRCRKRQNADTHKRPPRPNSLVIFHTGLLIQLRLFSWTIPDASQARTGSN